MTTNIPKPIVSSNNPIIASSAVGASAKEGVTRGAAADAKFESTFANLSGGAKLGLGLSDVIGAMLT